MQGREDRETRNTELIAGNISCLARSVRDVQRKSNMYHKTCRVEDRVDKSMFRGDEWGAEEVLQVMYAVMRGWGGWYITASYYSHTDDDCRCRPKKRVWTGQLRAG